MDIQAHLPPIAFDKMLPRIAPYWRRAELEDIKLAHVKGMSWRATGRVPHTNHTAKRQQPDTA